MLEQDGDGVYQIATAEELWDFAELVNGGKTDASAILTADIDLNNQLWDPIGNSSRPYRGTFNGNGHTISGLTINDSTADYQGLFGYVSGTVKNLTVSGTVIGRMYVGGIAGQNLGNVINCAFSGSVKGSGSIVGGVVGHNYIGGSVTNSYNTGEVSGSDHVGGVVGLNNSSASVENCYNTGSVNGSGNSVGGVVGDNSGTVENCYNTGSVSGNSYVGGVVGWNASGTVKNCYNTGAVNSSGNYVGGVAGYNSGTVENCYNTGTVSDGITSGGVVGQNSGSVTNCYFLTGTAKKGIGNEADATGATVVTSLNVQDQFQGWDFDNTWRISTDKKHPVLQANAEDNALSGTGKQEDPYKIYRAIDLKNFRDLVNDGGEKSAHAKLMNDINLSSVCGESLNGETSWNPIGSFSNSYKGTFDGNGKTISGLYIGTTANNQGLFGYVGTGGTVKDLTVSGTVSGSYNVGGVVGYNNGGTVTGCIFSGSGSVSGKNYVGGVVGYNYSGTVTGCIFSGSGSVSGEWYVGGIAGRNNGTVKNCYNTGQVNGSADSNDVGGVVGLNHGTVENCYNTGSVSGKNYVGGVVGYNNGGSVTNSYNTGAGTVTGTGDYVGGVVGDNGSSASVENCYNTGSVTSSGSYVGGVVGWNVSGYDAIPDGIVANCYFLKTTEVNDKLQGIGGGSGTSSNVEPRTADAFHSGEVAWLLQKGQKAGEGGVVPLVWGQSNLTATTSLPTLVALDKANAQKVYQVTFDYGTSFADNDGRYAYSYTNGVVSEPTKNPELAGHTLSGWYSDPSLTTAWTFNTEISNDTTLYAKWIEATPEPTPEPEPEEPPYTGKYSYEVFTSVGDNGAISVDRYATEGDKVTIDVTPDQAYKLDELVVTANGKDVELTANGDGTYTFTMPSADVRITASFAEDPDWTEPEEPSTDVSDLFIDVAPDAWYKDAVQYAYDNGLMTGVSDTEFAPEQTTTRAMIVSILARLEGVTTAQAAGFADVTDEWYATAVNWAANVGVVNGYEDNTYKPNTAITREQLAAILMNYAAYKGEDVSNRADLTSYTDQPSTWAEEAMSWAVAEGLISGVTNTELQPQGNATRAQVAAILQRFLDN